MDRFSHVQRWLTLATWLAVCGLLSCSSPASIAGIKVTGPVSLLDLFPQARKKTEASGELQRKVRIIKINLDGKPERALFLHPKSEVIFPLRIEGAAVLETAIALRPEAWEKEGDGVTFYIAVRRQDEYLPTYVYSRHLYPQLFEEHRGWQPVSIDLTPFQDTDFELILGTDPGPAFNPGYDWAVWKDPRLYNPATDADWVSPEQPKPRSRPQGSRF
ncbi:MAG: hypothetical protein ACE5JO_13200 [Candidatus Binatia bacterium]